MVMTYHDQWERKGPRKPILTLALKPPLTVGFQSAST
jgi:hypothetical protein